MSPTPSLTELGARVSSNASLIEQHLRSKDLASPSFTIDAPIEFAALAGEEKLQKARGALLEDCSALFDLMLGPGDYFRHLVFRFVDVSVLRLMYRYKIPQAVPLEGGTTQAEIAKATGVEEYRVRSIIRHAMTNRMFDQDAAGKIVHTAHSAMMVRDSALWDMIGFTTEEVFPASTKTAESLERCPQSDEPTESPFSLTMDQPDSAFGYYAKHEKAQSRFYSAVQYVSNAHFAGIEQIVTGYDWAAEGDATVVDVGGSTGYVSVAIAKQFLALKMIVQDLPEIVAAGEATLPDELGGQVKFMAHDFFTPQPVEANIYMLRFVLHNWPDKYAVRILRNLLPTLKKEGKILIMDAVSLPPKQLPLLQEKMVSNFDFMVWNLLNARQRSEKDWQELIKKTDSRLELSRITKLPRTIQSIIEVRFSHQ